MGKVDSAQTPPPLMWTESTQMFFFFLRLPQVFGGYYLCCGTVRPEQCSQKGKKKGGEVV